MKRTLKAAGLAALLLCAARAAIAQPQAGVPFGPVFTVDTIEDTQLVLPSIAANAVGGTVVAWYALNSGAQDGQIRVRRFSALGEPFSAEAPVAIGRGPQVAMSAAGSFVVAFLNPSFQLRFSLYGVDGTRLVDAASTPLGADGFNVGVGMDADGRFAIVGIAAGTPANFAVQRYLANGDVNGAPIVVGPADGAGEVDLAMAANGRFVAAYRTGAPAEVDARIFNADGTPVTDVFRVDQNGVAGDVEVAMDGAGNFVAIWPRDGELVARFFQADGTPRTDEVQVAAVDINNTVMADVAMAANGESAIVWDTFDDIPVTPATSDVFVRRYSPTGAPRDADAAKVNADRPRPHQGSPSIAMDADGDYTVVWQNGNGAGPGNNIHGQRFVGQENVDLGITLTDTPDPIPGGQTLTYDALVTNDHPAVAPIAGTSPGIAVVNNAIGSAHNVVVTATLPAGASAAHTTNPDWTCQTVGSSFECAYQKILAPGEQTMVPIAFTAPSDASSVQGTETLSAYQRDSNVNNNSASVTTAVGPGTGNGQTVQFAAAAESHAEGDDPFSITITMSQPSTQPVVVHYSAGGSAVKGTDYTVTPDGTVTIPAGETAATIAVTLIENTAPQSSRSAVFTLTSVTNAVLGANTTNTLTIIDDDNGVGGSNAQVDSANGQRVTFTTSSGSFSALSRSDEPTQAPEGFDYPVGFFSYQISGVSSDGQVTLTVKLPAGTGAEAWFYCPGAGCIRFNLSDSTTPGNAKITGDTVVVRIEDNGDGDNDPTLGVISGTVAPAKVKRSESGALSLAMLLPLLGAGLVRRRKASR